MPAAEFARINDQLRAAGKKPLPTHAMPPPARSNNSIRKPWRNASSTLSPTAAARFRTRFRTLHSQLLAAFKAWGVPTNPLTKICQSIRRSLGFHQAFQTEHCQNLPYGVDVVVKIDRYDWQEQLGYRANRPDWCIAYKYAAEQAIAKLIKIDWQVGKTGKLTPRATMEPVFVAGTTVQHATLHNLGEIRRKDSNT